MAVKGGGWNFRVWTPSAPLLPDPSSAAAWSSTQDGGSPLNPSGPETEHLESPEHCPQAGAAPAGASWRAGCVCSGLP